jgi:hypothetical protein
LAGITSGEEEIGKSIIVIVAPCGAGDPRGALRQLSARDPCEHAAAAVPVKPAGTAATERALRDKHVHPAVVVVVRTGNGISRPVNGAGHAEQATLAVIMPKIRVRVVAHQQIDKAVTVVVSPGRAKARSRRQAASNKTAIGLLTEEESGTGPPAKEKIDVPVVVDVRPGDTERARADIQNGALRDLGEKAVALVAIKQVGAVSVGDVEIRVSVIVDIHPGNAKAVGGVGHDRPRGDLGEVELRLSC